MLLVQGKGSGAEENPCNLQVIHVSIIQTVSQRIDMTKQFKLINGCPRAPFRIYPVRRSGMGQPFVRLEVR
jgi:hypothetical protein